MKIKSKKTGYLHDISAEEWVQMRERDEHRLYDVVDASDAHFESNEIKVEPISLFETVITDVTEDGTETEAEFIREYLDGIGVPYHANLGIKKLRKLYEDNI